MRALVWSVLVTFAILGASCRTPTEVRVIVRSDACTTSSSTSITIGSLGDIETKPPGPTSSRCDDGEVGSLVLQPSGEDTAVFALKVVMGIDKPADQCTAPKYEGCIVARRALSFLPHEELTVVVDMRAACKDKPCDPDQTCVKGSCVTAQIAPSDCNGGGCTEANIAGNVGGGSDGSGDGGPAPVKDASAGEGGSPKACLPLNSVCPVGSGTSDCCAGMSCTGARGGWRCCSAGPCEVGGNDCCDFYTCVFDGRNGSCKPR